MEQLVRALKEDIDASEESQIPECTASDLSLDASALIPLLRPSIGPYANGGENDLPDNFKAHWTVVDDKLAAGIPPGKKSHPQATVAAIIEAEDTRDRSIVQRAASRGIVAAIEALDGYKYSFNNAWAAKDEDGQRFSYICQDSMQNKDRHANGFTKTQKHLKGDENRGVRKPTYDCKGSISIKCSSTRGSLDVYYRHYAIHVKVAERKAPPRHTALRLIAAEESAYVAPPSSIQAPNNHQRESNVGRPLKRKRDSNVFPPSHVDAKPLSLVDLLKKTASTNPTPLKSPVTPQTNATTQSPPVIYDLPSWQKYEPVPAPPREAAPPASWNGQVHNNQPTPHLAPFGMPYQPNLNPNLNPGYYSQKSMHAPASQLQQAKVGVSQQEFFGTALKQHHPRGQGLFSTLKPSTKPVASDALAGAISSSYPQRPRPSCETCRLAKRKCDGHRPACSACQKTGRYDCAYDDGYSYPPSQMPPWQGRPIANMLPTANQPQVARVNSPDPWFPSR